AAGVRAAGAGARRAADDRQDAAALGGSRVLVHQVGAAVRGHDLQLERNAEALQDRAGLLHQRKVVAVAHQDADHRLSVHEIRAHIVPRGISAAMSVRYAAPSKAIRSTASYARPPASSSVGPPALTVSTRPPAATT